MFSKTAAHAPRFWYSPPVACVQDNEEIAVAHASTSARSEQCAKPPPQTAPQTLDLSNVDCPQVESTTFTAAVTSSQASLGSSSSSPQLQLVATSAPSQSETWAMPSLNPLTWPPDRSRRSPREKR